MAHLEQHLSSPIEIDSPSEQPRPTGASIIWEGPVQCLDGASVQCRVLLLKQCIGVEARFEDFMGRASWGPAAPSAAVPAIRAAFVSLLSGEDDVRASQRAEIVGLRAQLAEVHRLSRPLVERPESIPSRKEVAQ